jgi:hypothetical protein
VYVNLADAACYSQSTVSLCHVLHFLLTDRMDHAISFLPTVRMDKYQVALDGSTRRCSEFDYPLIVESSMNFNEVQRAMCNKYHWVMSDTVVVRYLDRDTNCYVDVKNR